MDPDELEEIMETLHRTRRKLRDLKEERDRLHEANGKLLRLVEELTDEAGERKEFAPAGYEYSYGEGWTPKDVVEKEGLDVDISLAHDDIKQQMGQVDRLLDRIRTYKNED